MVTKTEGGLADILKIQLGRRAAGRVRKKVELHLLKEERDMRT